MELMYRRSVVLWFRPARRSCFSVGCDTSSGRTVATSSGRVRYA